MSTQSIRLFDNESVLNILFAGDFGPMGVVESELNQNIQANIIAELKEPFQNKDLFVANLECPLTTRDTKIKKTGPSLKANPQSISFINDCSIDILNLSNNHIMDYGEEGLSDTINLLKDKTLLHGAGKNITEAKTPLRVSKNGIKLSFISYCETVYNIAKDEKAGCAPIDPIDIVETIQNENKVSDHVIISLHAGPEYYPLPSPKLKSLCHRFADSGVSAIICHHSHVINGYEVYNNVPIFYGLGNFIFDVPTKRKRPRSYQGLLVKIGFDKVKAVNLKLIPFVFDKTKGKVYPLDQDRFQQFRKRLKNLQDIIQDKRLLSSIWSLYSREMYHYYLSSRLRKARSYIWLSNEKRSRLLWLFRANESHSEVVETALKDIIDEDFDIPESDRKMYRELMGEISLFTKFKRIIRLIF